MGKRELVLIAIFAAVGIVVYQLTAPPAPAGSDLSVGGIFQRMQRSIHGPRETASGTSHRMIPLDAGITTVRINLPRPCDLSITGSDGDEIGIDIHSTARGFSPAEARTAADATRITDARASDTIALTGDWDDRRGPMGFVTQATIAISVPRRMRVSLLPHIGLLTVKDVAALDAASSRGETHVTGTAGDVRLQHGGGTLEIAGGASLHLTTRNSRGDVSGITGTFALESSGGRLSLNGLSGPLDIESRNSDISLGQIERMQPPLRYNGTGGALRVDGLRTEGRIDGHNTDLDIRLAAAAPVTIYNVGAIVVTAPPGGFTLDAIATDGRITSDLTNVPAAPADGPDMRVSAAIRGGGPVLTLRATRGRIDVRAGGK
jgi:hypothetical protein